MTSRILTAKGRATRERILASAIELFAAEGFSAVSIRKIADRSGVSTGAIYATFSGKAELLAEAVSASLAADLEIIDPDVQGLPLPAIVGQQFARLDQPGRRRLRLLLLNAAAAARVDDDVRDRLEPLLRARFESWTMAYSDWQKSEGIEAILDMGTLVALLISIDLGLAVLDELGLGVPDSVEARRLVEWMLHL